MKRNFIVSTFLGAMALFSLSIFTTSCSEDEVGAAPTINVTPASLQDTPGATVSFNVAVTAPNGGQLLTFTGVSGLSNVPLNGQSTQSVDVDYTIPATASIGSTILIIVNAVDKSSLNSLPAVVTITVGDPKPLVVVQGNISESNNNWVASNRYLLRGKVYVTDGQTLTIAAGTVILGEKETEGTLVVNRGGKINAAGTKDAPIVFTSNAPIGFRNRGDWGGIVILGKAYNSNGVSALIEGLQGSAGSENGLYGSKDEPSDDEDDSGILQYTRIEYAGIDLSQDNELNSLTMGSVGSATQIDHIVVSFANDDAYEWFGGSVNHQYLIAYSTLDDDFDTDRGYNGRIQYGLIIRDYTVADVSGARAFESSSNSNATAPTVGGTSRHSNPKFANITVVGPRMLSLTNNNGNYRASVEINSYNDFELYNSIITGFPNSVNYSTAGTNTVVQKNVFAQHGTQAPTDGPATFFTTDLNVDAVTTEIFGPYDGTNAYTQPKYVQVATSPYAADATAIPGFETTTFRGAFGTTTNVADWNFSSAWVVLDPQNVEY